MRLAKLFTKKQQEVLHAYFTKPFKIMILVGAVRAGKTYIDNYIFMYELARVAKQAKNEGEKHPRFILAGATSDSIYKNVISELVNQFGIDLKADRHGHYHLFGVDIVPVYTGSITGLKGARGFTSYGAYINEASLAKHEIFDEIQNRCSKAGSHIICDTNPDIPTHWLKTDYIDNHKPDAGIISFTFTIDDNSFLAKDYVTALKASKPAGVFYDRDILGLWATGAGIVYSDFDKNTMVIPDDEVPANLSYFAGVDWGFAEGHSNVVTLWGVDDKGVNYLIKCYSATGKYIQYWVDIAKDLQAKYGYNLPFWCDSARPEYVSAFQSAGLQARNAYKNVMSGVEYVSNLIKQGKLKVAQSASKPFLEDIYQYQWDATKGVPVKEHDNVMDSSRYALYSQAQTERNQTRVYASLL